MTRINSGYTTLISEELLNINSTGDISNLLKKVRESKNLTLKDVADDIKIRTTFLRNIEENEFKKLPGNVYAVGFTRTYSSYLGLDENLVIAALKAAPGFIEVKEVGPKKDFKHINVYKQSTIVTLISVLLIAVLWGAFSFFWNGNAFHKSVESEQPLESRAYVTISENQDDSNKDKDGESVSFQ